jgi:hypothetical protein
MRRGGKAEGRVELEAIEGRKSEGKKDKGERMKGRGEEGREDIVNRPLSRIFSVLSAG